MSRQILKLMALAFLSVLLGSNHSFACSPSENWRPPTTEQLYRASGVVVHLRVISQQGSRQKAVDAVVEVIKVFKGEFRSKSIRTLPNGACGLGDFQVGSEYVLFLPNDVSLVWIGNAGYEPTDAILEKINALQ